MASVSRKESNEMTKLLYVVWSIGGVDKYFNSCMQELSVPTFEQAQAHARELSKRHGVAGIYNAHDVDCTTIAYYEYGNVIFNDVKEQVND